MKLSFVLTFLMTFFFTACSEKKSTPSYDVVLSKNALNGITKKTPYSIQALSPLLPGFDIQTFNYVSATKQKSLLRVFYNDVEWFQVEPDATMKSIKSLHILSEHIQHVCPIKSNKKCDNTDGLYYFYNKVHRLERIELQF